MNGFDHSWEEQFLPPPLNIKDEKRKRQVEEALAGIRLGSVQLSRVMQVFTDEIENGLAQRPSSLQMENTYLPELFDGSEEGVFLALDLGGTNFRVLLLELTDGHVTGEEVEQYSVSEALRLGEGKELFQYLANCVAAFLQARNLQDEELSLGFTFSFPMALHSISSGELITWTKTFKCSGMKGVDVAALLQSCLREAGLSVRVAVLLNDTTGTLVAGAKYDPRTGIGVIFGTGSNGCYMERADRVQHWEAAHERIHDVIVDIEWGAFGDNGCLDFIRTDIDREVDNRSLLVKSFTFEKYISGRYLGDLLGAALEHLAARELFPVNPAPSTLTAAHLSKIEEEIQEKEGSISKTLDILCETSKDIVFTDDDARVTQYVAQVLSNRAAQLVSACIATLVRRIDRNHVTVAVDGSVFKCHPRMRKLMKHYMTLFAPGHSVSFILAEDGSGKGSALTAAIAARLARQAK